MKKFENEVLTFDVSSVRKIEKMRTALAEWGEAGLEIVSTNEIWGNPGHIMVFLKREITEANQEDAA